MFAYGHEIVPLGRRTVLPWYLGTSICSVSTEKVDPSVSVIVETGAKPLVAPATIKSRSNLTNIN